MLSGVLNNIKSNSDYNIYIYPLSVLLNNIKSNFAIIIILIYFKCYFNDSKYNNCFINFKIMKIILSESLKKNIITVINKTYNTEYAISNIEEIIINTYNFIVTMNSGNTYKIKL